MKGRVGALGRGVCLLLIVMLLSAAGCARQGAPEQSPSALQTNEAAANGEAGLVVLSADEDLMSAYAKAAYEQYGVQVTRAEWSNEADEQMLLDFAAGKATFDVVCVSNALGFLYTSDGLIDRGYFSPLSGVAQVEKSVSHMLPVLQDCVTRDGIIYALPYIARTKVLRYDHELYDAKADEDTARYHARTGQTVTTSWLQQIPDQQAYETWEELLNTAMLKYGWGDAASNAILEQYILSADAEDFSFDTESFRDALALMKTADTMKGPTTAAPAKIDINSFAYYTEDWFSEGANREIVMECDNVYAPPTIDAQDRLAMAYSVLAINAFSAKQEEALRFLECAADIGLNGDGTEEGEELGAILQYGSPDTAACYTDEAHIRTIAGNDPENQQRWRELTQRLAPITNTGYLTAFYLEIYPMYRDGAITAEQCARMTQERYEMYRAEQGR